MFPLQFMLNHIRKTKRGRSHQRGNNRFLKPLKSQGGSNNGLSGALEALMNLIKKLYTLNLQNRLILGFFIATCLTGILAITVGIRVINNNTKQEIGRRILQDINTARMIYNFTLERLIFRVQFIALGTPLASAIKNNNMDTLKQLNKLIGKDPLNQAERSGMDMLNIVDAQGNIIYSPSSPAFRGNIYYDDVLKKCLREKIPASSGELLSLEAIKRENPLLLRNIEGTTGEECLVLRAACPILDTDESLIGALVGGILLKKDSTLAEKIKQDLYGNEKYRGNDIGFTSIFQKGMRISSSIVPKEQKITEIDTVSKEISDRVIGEGKDWIGRTLIAGNWYKSHYTPIYDLEGRTIGMLCTGILDARYQDRKRQTIFIFLGIIMVGIMLTILIFLYLGNIIKKRIRILKRATDAIASGDIDYNLPSDKFSGFGMIDEAFNKLSQSLKERDDRLKRVFKQLTRTERLISLGQIAAGVAHEINNPLGGILLYSNLALEELSADSAARKNIENIIYQTNRCKEIVQSLLDFARTPSGEILPLSINEIIAKTLKFVRDQSIFLDIEIETRLSENLPEVRGNRSRLEQVFLNLFINAADAMENKGKITITTQLLTRKSDDFDRVVFETEKICLLTGTNMLKITVSDTGKGIDKNYQAHIFEPFFTTKDTGQGTGLGLSIAYGIIQQHDGFIDIESEEGKGTTFFILLPAGNIIDTGADYKQVI